MNRLRPWQFVLAGYVIYLGLILAAGGYDPLAFVRLGDGPNKGYDGQFTYLIAVEPSPEAVVQEIQVVRADVPAYRYQRILLPLMARAAALGNKALIAWTIPIINLIAQVIGTALVEALLVRLNTSRWYALVYGFWPGLAVAVRADLTEPLAYTLVAAAYLLHWRDQHWSSAVCFGVSLLAKETTLLFVAAQLGYAMFERQWKIAMSLGLLALLPFAMWQVILKATFGSFGMGSGGYLGTPFEIIPFNGLWRIAPQNFTLFVVFLLFLGPWVMFPAIWGIIASVRELLKRHWHPYVWALAANALIIPFTPFSTFREPVAMLRFCTGLVLSTLLFGGLMQWRRALNYSWFWLAMLIFLIKD